MRDYRFCVALRHPDGTLDEPMREEIITASAGADAIALAQAVEVNMTGLRANAVYLIDPNGHVVWSLRLADGSSVDS